MRGNNHQSVALLSAISLAISQFSCGNENPTQADKTKESTPEAPASATTAAPLPSALPSATESPEASASASPAPSAAPVATVSAAVSPPSPPPTWTPPPPKKDPMDGVVEGRPFYVAGVARLAPSVAGSDWTSEVNIEGHALSADQRQSLVLHYTYWARCEHASVASFARFSMQLIALAAPPDLLRRTAIAMQDEIRHAQLGFALVKALSGRAVGPGPLSSEGALEAHDSLEQVFRLTVRESLLGETFAALEAQHAADATTLPGLKAELEALAADEARHAELGFVFAAWAIDRDPALVRVLDEELAQFSTPPLDVVEGLETFGVLGSAKRERIRSSAMTEVIEPLFDQLRERNKTENASPLELRGGGSWGVV